MEEKKIKKIEKLSKDIEKAKQNLEINKKSNDESIKKAYEDIESWKKKEIEKGADPDKLEKRYQRGLRTIERISKRMDIYFEKMDTKFIDWEFKGRNSLEKAAHKKMIKKVLTSSLNKMENILEKDPNSNLRYTIAGYCAITKKDKINKIKYPNIFREIKAFENAVKKASKNDLYFKTFLSFVEEGNSKDKKLLFKKNVSKMVNKIIKDENISIRFLSEYTKIKYSNLYNFLKKEIYSELSFKRAHSLIWTTLNIKTGKTREEVFVEFKDTLKNNWEYDEIKKIKKEINN